MSNQTQQAEAPRIKKIAEVGETPFQFFELGETILQGWDKGIGRTIYLFKTETGNWGYFDKETEQVIEVMQWRGKAALIGNSWIKLSLYRRIRVFFNAIVNYSTWDHISKKNMYKQTQEAILTITNSTYDQLLGQMEGRPPESLYKFVFTSRKIGNRTMSYVNKVLWVDLTVK